VPGGTKRSYLPVRLSEPGVTEGLGHGLDLIENAAATRRVTRNSSYRDDSDLVTISVTQLANAHGKLRSDPILEPIYDPTALLERPSLRNVDHEP
jgi:hypothetical protein